MSTRRTDGRFGTLRDPIALYEIVRDVATIAANRDVDPFKKPQEVSQAAWNSARLGLEATFGQIPQANEVCRQLSDRSGRPFPWRALLELVFDEARDIALVHRSRLAEAPRPLAPAHIECALHRVAYHLRQSTLMPHEYTQGRAALLQACPAKNRAALASQLPTESQITVFYGGSWDNALRAAGLKPRPQAGPPPAKATVPVVDAIVFFYGKFGHLPTALTLDHFASDESFAKASHKGRPWYEFIQEAAAKIRAMNWPEPPAYGAPAPAEWRPLQMRLADAPARNTHAYSHPQVISHVRDFLDTVSGGNATDRRWREFSRNRHGIPSLGTTKAHGGLHRLIQEALRPDWEEFAESWVDPRTLIQQSKPKRTATELLAGRASKSNAATLLAAFEHFECSAVTAKQLAAYLGWTVPKTRDWLDVLAAADLVAKTQPYAQSKRQSYRRTTDSRTGIRPAPCSTRS